MRLQGKGLGSTLALGSLVAMMVILANPPVKIAAAPKAERVAYGIWRSDQHATTELRVINYSKSPVLVSAKLYDQLGQLVREGDIAMAANSTVDGSLQDLLAIDVPDVEAGLIVLSSDAPLGERPVAVTRYLWRGGSASTLMPIDPPSKQTIKHVMLWSPSRLARPRLSLANATAQVQQLTVQVSRGWFRRTVTLAAFGSNEIDIMPLPSGVPRALLISGPMPGFIAQGSVSDENGAVLAFDPESLSDTPRTLQAIVPEPSILVSTASRAEDGLATDFRLRHRLEVALANPWPREVAVSLHLLRSDGSEVAEARRVVHLRPHEGRSIETGLPLSPSDGVGAVIVQSASTVLAKAVLMNGRRRISLPINFTDHERLGISFANPLIIDEQRGTSVAFKNTAQQPHLVVIRAIVNGVTYRLGIFEVRPQATQLLDTAELASILKREGLEDEQVHGYLSWDSLDGAGFIIGRAFVADRRRGTIDTFSCPTECDCPPGFSYITKSPGSIGQGAIGSYSYLLVRAFWTDGSNFDVTPSASYSGYSNIISVSGGRVDYLNIGSTGITIAFSGLGYYWYIDANEECQIQSQNVTSYEGLSVTTQIPTSLATVSDSYSGGVGNYARTRIYEVRDHQGAVINKSGLGVSESYSGYNPNDCDLPTPNIDSTQTNNVGRFSDTYSMMGGPGLCGPPTPSATCGSAATQTIHVEQYHVANFGVTWRCSDATIQ